MRERPFRRLISSLAVCAGFLATCGMTLADLQIERIFGPETPSGSYKHASSITELDNGDLLLAFYGGSGEYESQTAVFGARLVRGTNRWSNPVVLATSPIVAMGNPVIWQAPDGRTWLFFVVRPGPTWSTSRIGAKISDDRGQTWSDTFMVTYDAGTMVRSRPIVLSDGHYLLPSHLQRS